MSDHSGENTEYKPLDQGSVTRALALHLWRKRIPTKEESRETSKVYMKKKKIKKHTVLVDRHTAASESRARAVV